MTTPYAIYPRTFVHFVLHARVQRGETQIKDDGEIAALIPAIDGDTISLKLSYADLAHGHHSKEVGAVWESYLAEGLLAFRHPTVITKAGVDYVEGKVQIFMRQHPEAGAALAAALGSLSSPPLCVESMKPKPEERPCST